MKFFDLHYHISPDRYKRKYNNATLQNYLEKNGCYAVIKSHLGSVIVAKYMSNLYPSIVLNEFVGGINFASLVCNYVMNGQKPMIVWMPTILNENKAVVNQTNYSQVLDFYRFKGVNDDFSNNEVKSNLELILNFCEEYNLPIATGHLDKKMVLNLIDLCKCRKIKLILTHPFYKGLFSVKELIEICKKYKNIYVECNLLMHNIGFESIEKDILLIGSIPEQIFVSSDLGQIGSDELVVAYEKYETKLFASIPHSLDSRKIANKIFWETPKKILLH